MKFLNIAVLISIAACSACAGCDNEPKRIASAPNVLFVSPDLADKVQIIRQTSDRIDGDLMRIRTQFKNLTDKRMYIDVQVVWKDKDGFAKYTTSWATVRLPAKLVEEHSINSMNANISDYEFRIRKPVKVEKEK